MVVLQALLIGIVTTIVVWYLRYSWKRKHLYQLAARIPGPNGLPLIGVALSVMSNDPKKNFEAILNISREYESPSRAWAGYLCFVIVDKPEDLQLVYNSQNCIDKATPYKVFPIQRGLLCNGGETWKTHRKLINPSFSVKILQSFLPIFNSKAKIMIKCLQKHVDGNEFDLYRSLSACTLEALYLTSLGIEKDIQHDLNNKYLHDMEVAGDILTNKFIKVWLHYKPLFKLTKYYKLEQKHIMKGIFKIADDILEEKKGQKVEENLNEMDDEEFYRKPQIFIDQILKFGNIFNEQDIKDEINTLIVAGHETSALTMASTLLMLAMHQDIQEKVMDEIRDAFDSVTQEVDSEILNKLPYLELVIKEAMRLFPVLPIIGRVATKDVVLNTCTIPAGANILIIMFNTHRNPLYWGDDAHLFRPDRFLPENISKIHPYAYGPFSGGHRICIGMKYGMNVMKVVLTHFLRNYKVTTNLKYEELTFKIEVSMKIVQNYMMKIEKRNFK